MIVSINQPAFLPWLGFYDRIYQSDVAIVLDHVQLERGGFTNRNRIVGSNSPVWLTVPIVKKGMSKAAISDILINNNTKWRLKHQETIKQSYSKAKYFNKYYESIATIYANEYSLLNELLYDSNNVVMDMLSIKTPLLYSSKMGVGGTKSDLVLNLCREVGATQYISGPFGRDYLNLNDFEKYGIEVLFHDYKHPSYKQLNGGFEAYMSVIDLLFNQGQNALKILSQGQCLSSQ